MSERKEESNQPSNSVPIGAYNSTYVDADIGVGNEIQFERLRHFQYFVHCLQQLPGQYTALDTNRLTLVRGD